MELNLSEIQALTMLWTVKEALSKVFKTGLMSPLSIYEVSEINQTDWNTYTSSFVNFKQYQAISQLHQKNVITIISPKNTEINFNINQLHNWMSDR